MVLWVFSIKIYIICAFVIDVAGGARVINKFFLLFLV
jgi:hypothetical protein